jgi:putative PIN family toxin of toxin-antitoxin system
MQMVNKGNVVLYLDRELLKSRKELGFNINKTFENHLKQLIRQFSTENSLNKVVSIELEFDPDDNVVLNTAYSGKADFIVTGDKHLLSLEEFKRTKIVKVDQMLEILR